uniref:Secreted protein n=1 Tax=Loa loa TaxID=7209 RepID=A0A1I7VY68_LOALO
MDSLSISAKNMQQIALNPLATMLTTFFMLYQHDAFAKTLLYLEALTYYMKYLECEYKIIRTTQTTKGSRRTTWNIQRNYDTIENCQRRYRCHFPQCYWRTIDTGMYASVIRSPH